MSTEDVFDTDFDDKPEGSILTPIFLGCGAMGLGCLFSVGIIAGALALFAPGLWSLIQDLDAPFAETAYEMVRTNPEVIAAIGEPTGYEVDDLTVDEEGGTDITIGDVIELNTLMVVTGPQGTVDVTITSNQQLDMRAEQELRSVIVRMPDGSDLRLYPTEADVPPPPAQLAPPGDEMDAAVPDTPEPVDATDNSELPEDVSESLEEDANEDAVEPTE